MSSQSATATAPPGRSPYRRGLPDTVSLPFLAKPPTIGPSYEISSTTVPPKLRALYGRDQHT
jgi:hypothetical protein